MQYKDATLKNSPSYRLELFKNFVLWIFSLFFKPSNTD